MKVELQGRGLLRGREDLNPRSKYQLMEVEIDLIGEVERLEVKGFLKMEWIGFLKVLDPIEDEVEVKIQEDKNGRLRGG